MKKEKKYLIKSTFAVLAVLLVSCKSLPQEDFSSPDSINKYFATSEQDCSYIFEFVNQSNKVLKVEPYIAETKNLINNYIPLATYPITVVEAGECLTYKINADKLIKDFSKNYSIGLNCFEKNWHWWQTIEKQMKNKRCRIIVKNDSREGGQFYNFKLEGHKKFAINEINVDYQNRNYAGYIITETPEEYKQFFDTRIFYENKSNNYARKSNIFTRSCKEMIQELLEKGDFHIDTLEGFKFLMLNNDPLDLNKYVSAENDSYDFIYEIVNNSDNKIRTANILLDEESKVLSLTNDVEIESGKSYQLKFNLENLKKIYGEKAVLELDVRKSEDSQWIRGWRTDLNHKGDKYIVVVNNGTQDRALDIFDLWKDFSELEKGIMIY